MHAGVNRIESHARQKSVLVRIETKEGVGGKQPRALDQKIKHGPCSPDVDLRYRASKAQVEGHDVFSLLNDHVAEVPGQNLNSMPPHKANNQYAEGVSTGRMPMIVSAQRRVAAQATGEMMSLFRRFTVAPGYTSGRRRYAHLAPAVRWLHHLEKYNLPFQPGITPRFCVLLALIFPLMLAACDELPGTTEPAAKVQPVSIIRLRERDFTRETKLTGSVGLYRQEKIGFEVGARLLAVRDLGREVTGPSYDENGKLVREGDIVAQLDDRRYRLKVKALEARLRSLKKELEAQKIDLDKVAYANLDAARATFRVAETELTAAGQLTEEGRIEVTRARKELDRQKVLMRGAAGRQKQLDEAQAAYDRGRTRVAQFEARLKARGQALEAKRAEVSVAEATIALKRAQVESTYGKIAELEETLSEARENLKDTILRAPFTGRITAIHAVQGAVLTAGSAVATLSLLDPIQVHVEMSGDDDRRIRTGDKALLFPKDPIDPEGARLKVDAVVFEKDAVANPKTRTFRITMMARNERRKIEHLAPETRGLPLVEDFLPTARRYKGEPGPLFIPIDAIYVENGQSYVLLLPGVGFQDSSNRGVVGKHVPEKVKVNLGGEYLGVIKWRFRSITGSGPLKEGDFLVIGPKKEHLSGLAIGRPQWLLRPGELVPVRFVLDKTPRGFYVPINAITEIGGRAIIFTIRDGKAQAIQVSVQNTYGEYRRIEADALVDGLPVIHDGLHYVNDGQPVNVLEEEGSGR